MKSKKNNQRSSMDRVEVAIAAEVAMEEVVEGTVDTIMAIPLIVAL